MTDVTDWSWAVAGDAPISNSRTDDIWFFDESNGWLVNSNGQVHQTTDGGLTWHQKRFIDPSMPGFPYLRCMGWPNERVGWIGSVTKFSTGKEYLDVLLHKTEDGGAIWTALTNLPQDSPAGICGMFAVSEDVVYGAGTNDPDLPGPGVIKTTDGGASWAHRYVGTCRQSDRRLLLRRKHWLGGRWQDRSELPQDQAGFRDRAAIRTAETRRPEDCQRRRDLGEQGGGRRRDSTAANGAGRSSGSTRCTALSRWKTLPQPQSW